MCGFIGSFSNNQISLDLMNIANKNIICRGPDNKTQLDGSSKDLDMDLDLYFSFIFNRLSIIDLSESANQPMFSKAYKTLIMFNGEIYNHKKLRADLEAEGAIFSTDHSDTEVLLIGLSIHGLKYIDNLIGQFSIFFLDQKIKKAYLVRDRIGQKPLFYFSNQSSFVFGSNLKSLVKLTGDKDVDESSIAEYLNLGVVTSPNTIFQNHYKVEPGEILEFDLQESFKKSKFKYWSIEKFYGNDKFEQNRFNQLLVDSVEMRNVSDVPVANFLSGGIDSTLIVKLQSEISAQTNTYTVGYEDKKYDESKWAQEVSKKYSTNHFLDSVSEKEIDVMVSQAIHVFDEPYADPSTVPSYSISKLISQNYKVAISGDGGDELAAGYLRTHEVLNSKKYNSNLVNRIFNLYPDFIGSGINIMKHSNNLSEANAAYFQDKKLLRLLGVDITDEFFDRFTTTKYSPYKNLMFTEYKFYLSEQMMLKVDRTSMANSLEVRSPLVDHRLIEYMFSTSEDVYFKKEPKALFKQYLQTDFDEKFLERKKMGFVFNVENYVENNIDTIQDVVFGGIDIFSENKLNIKKLSRVVSRTNALRYWKLFVLQSYLDSL